MSGGVDQHTVIVRRRIAAGVGVVLLIVIVLLVNGCLKSEKQQALKNYNHNVNQIAAESAEQVSTPLFSALTGAGEKSPLSVEVQIDQLRIQAQNLANRVKSLGAPSAMSAAQHNLELVYNLRAEGVSKIAALIPTALSGQAKQASTTLAGDMEIFLASDVIYSQRVVPLIQQTLAAEGIHGLTTNPSHFLPNLGWLEPSTVQTRVSGKPAGSEETVTGNHGSALKGVSVGNTTLEGEPTLNHIAGGGNPTFTMMVENSGEFAQTNVKVEVTITAAGKQYKASSTIEKTEPGKTVNVNVPVTAVPTGVASKIEAYVVPVPGENDVENNKATYLAVFEG